MGIITISDPKAIQILRKGMDFNPFFTEGKKLQTSFIFMAKKNAGKTKKVLDTFRGPMLILSYDNQTEIIVEEKIKAEMNKFGGKSFTKDNVLVANLYPGEYRHIGGSGKERRLEVGYAICNDTEKILDNIRKYNIHFDYIVVDGYPELKDRIMEYARKRSKMTFDEDILGEDLKVYGHRNRFYQNLVYSMFELSDICPVMTTYPKVDLSRAFKGHPPPEPEIDKTFVTIFRNVVWIERTIEEKMDKKNKSGSIEFYAYLQSMKGIDFGEEGKVMKVTGDVPVFPIEKLEAYRKGNPLNPIETPEIHVSLDPDDEAFIGGNADSIGNTTETMAETDLDLGKTSKSENKDEKKEVKSSEEEDDILDDL